MAFGTSAPELVVNIVGAVRNQTDLAFGNVVGSNLANLGLVLCTAALIKPMKMQGQIVRRELPLLLLGNLCLAGNDAGSPFGRSMRRFPAPMAWCCYCYFSIFIYISLADVLGRRQDAFISNIDEIRGMLPAPMVSGLTANWIYVGLGQCAWD